MSAVSASTPTTAPPAGPATGAATEASLLPRFVALLTPLFAIVSGTIANWVAQHTGAHLDQGQMSAFMVTASTTALAASWKWLHGWQQHELLVAQGIDAPRRRGTDAPIAPAPDQVPPAPAPTPAAAAPAPMAAPTPESAA